MSKARNHKNLLRRASEFLTIAGLILLAVNLVLAFFSVPAGAVDAPAGQATTTLGVTPTFKALPPDGDLDVSVECQYSDAPFGFRINAPEEGLPTGTSTYTDNGFSITLTILSANPPASPTHEGPSFDFAASGGVVEDILVKGGPDANFYDYEGTVGSATADTYLHSPVNPANDTYFGVSHIDVCYNEEPEPEPGVEVTKSGSVISKVGDTIFYAFTITNTGDVTLYLDTITDTIVLDIEANAVAAGCGTLDPGDDCSFSSVFYTVLESDPDPLVNEVTVVYNTDEDLVSGTSVSDSDTHSVNLFVPSVEVTKTGPATASVGEPITYTFTITNTASDSPTLILDSISDTVLGDLAAAAPADCDSLSEGGGFCSFDVDYTIAADDPDPLDNTVTVHYHPVGFENDISDSDPHSVDITPLGEPTPTATTPAEPTATPTPPPPGVTATSTVLGIVIPPAGFGPPPADAGSLGLGLRLMASALMTLSGLALRRLSR